MFVGTSESVAVLVKVMLVNSAKLRVLLLRLVRIGALFTSLTKMVKLWVALMVGTTLLLGPCASVGVQVRRPDWLLNWRPPTNGATNAKVSVFVGRSESLATRK